MEEVEVIYHNELGIAFKWKEGVSNADSNRIQLIFKDMGFYLKKEEIMLFSGNVRAVRAQRCRQCQESNNCRNVLLKGPFNQIDFAVTEEEAVEILDLVEGTLFWIDLNHYLNDTCKN